MKKLLLILPVIVLLLAGCNNEDTGSVEIVFKGTYGDQPLVMLQTYPYAFDQTVQFLKSDFYVSNIRFVEGNGLVRDGLDVELVDLSFSTASEAEEGFLIRINDIEAQTYERIQFGIGLTPDQNAGRPDQYPSSNPLAAPRYWEPWTSYIFAKTEGKIDTDADGDHELNWLYHTGTDPLYRDFTAIGGFAVVDGGTLRVEIELDHRKLFGVDTDPIDIASKPVNHNPLDTNEIRRLTDNYESSMQFLIQ